MSYQDTADTLHMAALRYGHLTKLATLGKILRDRGRKVEVENSSRGQTGCCRWGPPAQALGRKAVDFKYFPDSWACLAGQVVLEILSEVTMEL